MRAMVLGAALPALLFASACDDTPAPNGQPMPEPIASSTPTAEAPAAAGAVASDGGAATSRGSASQAPLPGQAQGAGDSGKARLRTEIHQTKLRNEDFVESEDNRDPFHSFLSDFSGGQATVGQHEILLPKYSLDELKLNMVVGPPTVMRGDRAVVTGHVEPRAMFIDPTGFGVPVTRGKFVSKADARVVRIEPENGRVYVEIKEDLGNGKSRVVERVLELHQGEPMQGLKP